jgi:hypothetical protein
LASSAGIALLIRIHGGLFRQLRKLKASPAMAVFLFFLAYIVVRGLA